MAQRIVSNLRKNLENQARRFLLKHYGGIGENKTKAADKIHSTTTLRKHVIDIAKAAEAMGVKRLKHITPDMAQHYLNQRKELNIAQGTLNNERNYLERVVFYKDRTKKLSNPIATQRQKKALKDTNRAYTKEQIVLIKKHQFPHNRFATELAYISGLRAQELLTIQRINEATVSPHRIWRDDRFVGLSGVKYIVCGKNGLYREVIFTKEMAEKLEQHRLGEPRTVYDNGAKIQQFYNIAGGHNFSESFSNASKRVLGWSLGAHGLRFSYAQHRIDNGITDMTYLDIKSIISQELGHFRPDITERYLKP